MLAYGGQGNGGGEPFQRVGVYAESQSACECYEACFLPVAVGASEQPLYAVGLGVESLEGKAVEPSVEVYVFD